MKGVLAGLAFLVTLGLIQTSQAATIPVCAQYYALTGDPVNGYTCIAPIYNAGGDLAGTFPNPTLSKINGVAVGTAATQNTTGAGAAIVTGPTTSVAGDLLDYTTTSGQAGDATGLNYASGVLSITGSTAAGVGFGFNNSGSTGTGGKNWQVINQYGLIGFNDVTDGISPFSLSSTYEAVGSTVMMGWLHPASLSLDTAFSEISAGVIALGTGSANNTAAQLRLASVVSGGTKFTGSGCSVSATTGGATAGTYTSGSAGICTYALTLPTAPNGWQCQAADRTTPTDAISETASTTTTATLSGTTASGDVIGFFCVGY